VQVWEEATAVEADYEPPMFKSQALQHTKPQLTWDADNVDRKKILSKKVTAEELKEDDFKAYLASDSGSGSGSDGENGEDVETIRARCSRSLCCSVGDGLPVDCQWPA
jgi:hypothetical protein